MWIRRTVLGMALACAITGVGAGPAMAVRYASPSGTTGDPCTLADPCTVEKAIEGTPNGDPGVQLFGGDYPPLDAVVQTVWPAHVGPVPGTGRPVIHVVTGTQLRISGGSRIADVDIVVDSPSGEPLFLNGNGTLGERLRLSGDGLSALVKIGAVNGVAVLRDTLVVNSAAGASAAAVAIECNGCTGGARVVNVTALSNGGPALSVMAAGAAGTQTSTMTAVNTIAVATGAGVPDLKAVGFGDDAILSLSNVAYDSSEAAPPDATITGLGAGNVSAPPLLAGDRSPLPGSPTIDAGIDPGDLAATPLDVLGRPRVLGAAIDIGAFEAPAAPLAVTGEAGSVGQTSASIGGLVTPGGLAAAWRIEYGTTSSYGTTVAGTPDTSAGHAAEAVAVTLAGLAPATTYHYRLVAQHAFGTSAGADRTFTTTTPPADPGTGGTTTNAPPPTAGPAQPVYKTPLPPLAKACLSVRDFTIRLPRGVKARSVSVTVDGRRATVTRGKRITARVNLRGTPKRIVVVKVVVTDSRGKRKTTLRRYRTCAKKTAGANTVVT